MADLPIPGGPGIIITPGGEPSPSPREGRWPWDPSAPPPPSGPPVIPAPGEFWPFPAQPAPAPDLPPAPPVVVTPPAPGAPPEDIGSVYIGPYPIATLPPPFGGPPSEPRRTGRYERGPNYGEIWDRMEAIRYDLEGYDPEEFGRDYGWSREEVEYLWPAWPRGIPRGTRRGSMRRRNEIPPVWVPQQVGTPPPELLQLVDTRRVPTPDAFVGPILRRGIPQIIRRQAQEVRKRQQAAERARRAKRRQTFPDFPPEPPVPLEPAPEPIRRERPSLPRPVEVPELPDVRVPAPQIEFPPVELPRSWPMPAPPAPSRVPLPQPVPTTTPRRAAPRAPRANPARRILDTLLGRVVLGRSAAAQRLQLTTPPALTPGIAPPAVAPGIAPPAVAIAPPSLGIAPLTAFDASQVRSRRGECECKSPAKRRKCRARRGVVWASGPKKGKAAGSRCISFLE